MALYVDGTKYLKRTDTCGISAYPFTMVQWFRVSSLGADGVPVGFADTDGLNYQHTRIRTGGTIRAYSRSGGTTSATTTTTYTDDVWSHTASVFTSSTLRDVYLNGSGKGSNTDSVIFNSGLDNTVLGASLYAGGVYHNLTGDIAETAIYDIALSADEVAQLAAGFSPLLVRPQNLIAYWPLVDNANDIVGGYNLTHIGGTLPKTDHPRIILPARMRTSVEKELTVFRSPTLSGDGTFEVAPKIKVKVSSVTLSGSGTFDVAPNIKVNVGTTTLFGDGEFDVSYTFSYRYSITNFAMSGLGEYRVTYAPSNSNELGEPWALPIFLPHGTLSDLVRDNGSDPRFNNAVPLVPPTYLSGNIAQDIPWTETKEESIGGVMDDRLFWYEQVTLLPRLAQLLGYVAAKQSIPIDLYNADRKNSVTITSVIDNLASGVSISGVPTPPFDLGSQESLEALITVETSGDASVDSDYSFVTAAGTYTIYITGDRTIMFPIRPQAPLREHLVFNTAILEAIGGSEQRIANRKSPRSKMEMTIKSDRQAMEIFLFDNQNKVLAVPVWHEPSYITSPVVAEDLTIYVDDTRYSNFYEGGSIIIFQDSQTYDALTIESLTQTSITFASGPANNYGTNVHVMPLITAYIQEAVAAQKNLNNIQTFNLVLNGEAVDNDIASAAGFSDKGGVPFVDNPNMVVGGALSEVLEQKRLVLDNQTGLFDYYTQWDRNKRRSIKGFKTNNRQELWELRQFLHYLKGQQVAFYIPTFSKDLVPIQTLANASAVMNISNIGYNKHAREREPKVDIRIWLTNGTLLERTIVDSSIISSTEEQLTVDTTWPYDIEPEEIERIEFIEKVRINVDDIIITHYNALGISKTFIPTKEVFD